VRLHTKLYWDDINQALKTAQRKGRVGKSVVLAVSEQHESRSHARAFEIQLGSAFGDGSSLPPGAANRYGKPQKMRRARNFPGGDVYRFAATWHEWGWFMREVFELDRAARWGGAGWGYKNLADFNDKTGNVFAKLEAVND